MLQLHVKFTYESCENRRKIHKFHSLVHILSGNLVHYRKQLITQGKRQTITNGTELSFVTIEQYVPHSIILYENDRPILPGKNSIFHSVLGFEIHTF